jgi:uracil-DNA glycosylase
MADNTVWLDLDGRKVRTLRDILPETPALRALFVGKTPAPVSVRAGHYFQGQQGRQFWTRLKKYGILQQRTEFEDDSLLGHGFGVTDIAKVPRGYGNEPSVEEYKAGITRILQLIQLHKPTVVVFIYKRVLDEVLRQHYRIQKKSVYGFNPSLDHYFGTRAFVFPLPGTPCTTVTADSAMRELASVLGHGSEAISKRSSGILVAPDRYQLGNRFDGDGVEKGPRHEMRSTREVVDLILGRFEERGSSQVPGYKSFGFVCKTDVAVMVRRENGKEARIPISKIEQGILAVRANPSVYSDGPSKLRQHGITHVNSVVWSLLHLVNEDEIRAGNIPGQSVPSGGVD